VASTVDFVALPLEIPTTELFLLQGPYFLMIDLI